MFSKIKLERLLSLPLFLLFINNTNTGITHNYGIMYYVGFSLPFLVVSLFLFFTKLNIPNNTLAHLCLIISIVSIIDNDISNYSGAFFFMSSISISLKNKYNYAIYGLIFIASLIYKFNLLGALPSQILGYLSGVSFYAIIHFKKVHKSKEAYMIDCIKDINPDILEAMEAYLDGVPWDNNPIAIKKSVSGKHVRRLVKNEYKSLGLENIASFAHYIGKMSKGKNLEKSHIT